MTAPAKRCGNRDDGQGGFSLLEVLAALTILAVVLSVAYRLLGDSLASVRVAEMRAAAIVIAEAQLAALGSEGRLQPGDYPGRDSGFRWTLSIAPHRAPPFDRAGDIGLAAFEVTVAVTDPRGAVHTLNTLRLVPADRRTP